MVKKRSSKSGKNGSGDDSSEGEDGIRGSHTPEPLDGPQTFEEFATGLTSSDKKVVKQTSIQLVTYLDTFGVNELGSNGDELQKLLELCSKAPLSESVECAIRLSEYLTGSENKQFLEKMFVEIGCASPPPKMEKGDGSTSELYQRYATLMQNIELKVTCSKESYLKIWKVFFASPHLFYGTILAKLNQLTMAGQMSDKEKVGFLEDTRRFLEDLKSKRGSEKRQLKRKLSTCFRLVLGAIYETDVKDVGKISQGFIGVMDTCKGMERRGWTKCKDGPYELASGDEQFSESEDEEGQQTGGKPLNFSNLTVYEACLHEIARSSLCSYKAELRLAVVEANLDYFMKRIESSTKKSACISELKECDCSFDVLTESCLGIMLEFICVEHTE